MERTIDYILADPAGNITILVVSRVNRTDYQSLAKAMLQRCPEAEQVGYIIAEEDGGPKMEMCGLEFCGNASRAYACYLAMCSDPVLEEVTVRVSGCDSPLRARIDRPGERVEIEIPVPAKAEPLEVMTDIGTIEGTLVHMDGIFHFVVEALPEGVSVEDRAKAENLFGQIREKVYADPGRDYPAFGVMFADKTAGTLIPIVYVRDVDTTYYEGSCASGTAATGFALALGEKEHRNSGDYTFREPAGELRVIVEGDETDVREMRLDGSVRLSEILHMTITEGTRQ